MLSPSVPRFLVPMAPPVFAVGLKLSVWPSLSRAWGNESLYPIINNSSHPRQNRLLEYAEFSFLGPRQASNWCLQLGHFSVSFLPRKICLKSSLESFFIVLSFRFASLLDAVACLVFSLGRGVALRGWAGGLNQSPPACQACTQPSELSLQPLGQQPWHTCG